ncbi:MAG: MaoC family dehydratase [Rhodospirillaceae bacterium]|nr:MaoC family dehydratase [Rhodospirillaceae bacterium]
MAANAIIPSTPIPSFASHPAMTEIRSTFTFDTAPALIGTELGVTKWHPVTQKQVNQFANVTQDHDWIHINPERARQEGPYDGTISFGFFTLSLLTAFSHEVGLWPSDARYGLNYGLNKVRWITPVLVGSRIRGRFALIGFDPHASGGYMSTTEATVEIEGCNKPAMVAEWLGLFMRK